MELLENYTDINRTLWGIRQQVLDSLEYCVYNMPKFKDPEQMFQYLKLATTYVNDPHGNELVQSVPTLMENNFHGVPGAGDCDCFTVLTLAMCIANGWNDNYIVLVGRTKIAPVHIYSAVEFDGKFYTLDLTNPYINLEREYPYRQILPV